MGTQQCDLSGTSIVQRQNVRNQVREIHFMSELYVTHTQSMEFQFIQIRGMVRFLSSATMKQVYVSLAGPLISPIPHISLTPTISPVH
jgi:hypothetical protein